MENKYVSSTRVGDVHERLHQALYAGRQRQRSVTLAKGGRHHAAVAEVLAKHRQSVAQGEQERDFGGEARLQGLLIRVSVECVVGVVCRVNLRTGRVHESDEVGNVAGESTVMVKNSKACPLWA